ncbi:MAG: hypothetical protein KAT39_02370, partial [Alphaproteobacteria bacterium]|nr:hypothetical protein [Alphaproteobacteria bacterium]
SQCRRPIYVGREESAAPATGLLRRHIEQQNKLVDHALTVTARPAAKSSVKNKGKAT